ncbi:TPA: carboxylesterase family protein [Staphylococcus argenteus]|nr:carboxylesterase family protein [Staphylococcus argenteus]HDY9438227.1 carboxylesterase family protein [Staphylococcus argenteus]HDY9443837.1 carboxylesterase family protein [Staphylococcus argenteus]
MLKIESGLIQGFHRNNTYYFLGIPYAEPPVSNLDGRRRERHENGKVFI